MHHQKDLPVASFKARLFQNCSKATSQQVRGYATSTFSLQESARVLYGFTRAVLCFKNSRAACVFPEVGPPPTSELRTLAGNLMNGEFPRRIVILIVIRLPVQILTVTSSVAKKNSIWQLMQILNIFVCDDNIFFLCYVNVK